MSSSLRSRASGGEKCPLVYVPERLRVRNVVLMFDQGEVQAKKDSINFDQRQPKQSNVASTLTNGNFQQRKQASTLTNGSFKQIKVDASFLGLTSRWSKLMLAFLA